MLFDFGFQLLLLTFWELTYFFLLCWYLIDMTLKGLGKMSLLIFVMIFEFRVQLLLVSCWELTFSSLDWLVLGMTLKGLGMFFCGFLWLYVALSMSKNTHQQSIGWIVLSLVPNFRKLCIFSGIKIFYNCCTN